MGRGPRDDPARDGQRPDRASSDAENLADELPHRSDLWAVSLSRQRRSWAWFVAVVGLALLGLCLLDYSPTALVLGAVLLLVGLVGALVPGAPR